MPRCDTPRASSACLGGTVAVDSEPGAGTTFVVSLPLAAAARATA